MTSCADDDGDGHRSSACGGDDCDDANAARYPTATEVCNAGIDDDCNGFADAADGVYVPCGPGLSGLDTMCVDIDECLMGVCGAAVGATCNNTRGS